MSQEKEGCMPRLGCTSPLGVLLLGLGLSIFGVAVGGGCSVRIPLTEASVSTAGSVGSKDSSRRALPGYLEPRVASSKDFINSSTTLTIWVAEGTGLFVVGEQPGSPLVDLYLGAANRDGKVNLDFPKFLSYSPREVK